MGSEPNNTELELEIREADGRYQSVPEFSAWKGLTAEDERLLESFSLQLSKQRDEAGPEIFIKAVEVATRAAAVDTGAIEGLYEVDRGFTMSVALQNAAWLHNMREIGSDVRDLFQSQLASYELVLDAATKRMPVMEAWIRAVHEQICSAQRSYSVVTPFGSQEHELKKGEYKTLPNHVKLKDGRTHSYSPVDQVSPEMHRLVDILRSAEFDAAHALLQASYVHYALVHIHPFADGNGRVARALASLYYYRALSIPFVVFVDRKPSYLEALQRADEGQTRPLIRFFRERAIETMLLIDDNLRAAKAPALQEVTTSFATLHAERAGLSFQAQDNIALHLLAEVSNQIKVRFEQLHVSGVSLQTLEGRSAQKAPEGYRRIAEAPWKAFNVAIESRYPAPATINSSFHVIIQTDNDSYFAFRVVAADWNLDVRLEDIYPATSTSFQLRLDSWLDGILRTLLARLAEAGKRAYREILDR